MSKRGLATGSDLRVSQVPVPSVQGGDAFGLRPTTSPASAYAAERNGSEYLLSSQATPEAGNAQGFSQSINLWALSNTNSLAPGGTRSLDLRRDRLTVDRYGVPPLSDQRPGPYPLGECLSDTSCRSEVLGVSGPASPHAEGPLDSSDSRMHQTVYARGLVFGALDTVVNVGGQDKAGVAYYVIRPSTNPGDVLKASLVSEGTLALARNNLLYPAFGVDPAGQAVMALNVVGADHYPSAAYVTFDAAYRAGAIHMAAEGVGPQDGFTEYSDFSGGAAARPRWGDYSATSFDPSTGSIWMANEYIAQSCTLAQYRLDPTCGGSRSPYGNWATRISQYTASGARA